MEGGEQPPINFHLEKFARDHKEDIEYLADELGQSKAVYLEASPHSGKTSLGAAAFSELLRREPEKTKTYYSTPSQQEVLTALPVKDRTGITYRKLPTISELEALQGDAYILLDEISAKGPDPIRVAQWKEYIGLPNTHFLLLGHPNSSATAKWLELFPEGLVKTIPFEEEQKAA